MKFDFLITQLSFFLIPFNSFSLSGEYKVYSVRWVVLAIFVLYSASNAMQWIQFSIIANVIQKYVLIRHKKKVETEKDFPFPLNRLTASIIFFFD